MHNASSTRTWWDRLLLVVVLTAVVLMATSCGSSEDEGSPSDPEQGSSEESIASPLEAVEVAYRRTAEAETAKMDMSISMSMSGMQGGAQQGMPKGAMNMDMGGQGEIDFTNQRSNFVMQMPMGMGEMEMRQIGTVGYMRMPEQMRTQNPEGRPWLRIDLDEMMQDQYGASFSEMQGGGAMQSDPTLQLEFLRSVSDSVEEVGEEEVRGEPTTHYRAVIDLERAADERDLSEEAHQAREQLVQQLGASELPVDVWINDEGRVRRYETNTPLPTPPQGGPEGASQQDVEGEINIAYELYDFGTPVEVEEPPADQVTDMQEFMETAQQQQGAVQQ